MEDHPNPPSYLYRIYVVVVNILPMEKYFRINIPMQSVSKRSPNLSFMTSRGCPYRCTFCSSSRHWGKWRPRGVDDVLDEMGHLIKTYGVRELKFEDDNITFDAERSRKLFNGMIDRGYDLTWNTPNGIGVRTLTEEMITLMKRAGCFEVTLAIESGDPTVLRDIIKKPLNLVEAEMAAKRCNRMGIETTGYFIFGFPGETRDEMWDTYRLAQSLDLDGAYFFIATPLPGTELCEKGMAEGNLDPDLDFTAIEFNKGHFNTPEWSAKDVEQMTGTFYLRFMLTALRRHPLRFFKNYGRVIISRPWYVVVHFMTFLTRWIKEKRLGQAATD